jgi:NADP-dependent 3-hydroxy acid dehydrogenase YdfG
MLAARREDRPSKTWCCIEKTGGTVAYRSPMWQIAPRCKHWLTQLGTYGRIDVLVNNAALIARSPLDQIKVDEWDQIIDVNLKGVLYGIAAVLPTMRQQKSGHVINLSSIGGHKVFRGGSLLCYQVCSASNFRRAAAGVQTVNSFYHHFTRCRLRRRAAAAVNGEYSLLPTFHPMRSTELTIPSLL